MNSLIKIKKDLFALHLQNKMIGLFFGESNFPKEILKSIKKKNIKYTIIDLTRKKIFKKDKNSYSVSIGQFGKILKILKKNKCKKVLFAGKVIKPNFSSKPTRVLTGVKAVNVNFFFTNSVSKRNEFNLNSSSTITHT